MTKEEHEKIGKKFEELNTFTKKIEKLDVFKNNGVTAINVYFNGNNEAFTVDKQSYDVIMNMVRARHVRKQSELSDELRGI